MSRSATAPQGKSNFSQGYIQGRSKHGACAWGIYSRDGGESLAFIPAALLGAWFGLRIFKRLSDRQFERAVNLLLIASGGGLIV